MTPADATPASVDQDRSNLPDRSNPKVRQLLDAAHDLLLNKTYDAVSTDAIAKAAKVSKATLYAYFPSKEALFVALISDHCSQLAQNIETAAGGNGDIESMLRTIARDFITLFASPDALALYRSIIAQAVRFPELGRMFHDAGPKVLQARIADILKAATARGEIEVPDAPLAALQFVQLIAVDIQMTGLLALRPLVQADMERTMESGINLFLAGYGASSRNRSGAKR